jgi:hypothetical protein
VPMEGDVPMEIETAPAAEAADAPATETAPAPAAAADPTKVDLTSGMYAGWKRKSSKKDPTRTYLRSPGGGNKVWEAVALKNVAKEAAKAAEQQAAARTLEFEEGPSAPQQQAEPVEEPEAAAPEAAQAAETEAAEAEGAAAAKDAAAASKKKKRQRTEPPATVAPSPDKRRKTRLPEAPTSVQLVEAIGEMFDAGHCGKSVSFGSVLDELESRFAHDVRPQKAVIRSLVCEEMMRRPEMLA